MQSDCILRLDWLINWILLLQISALQALQKATETRLMEANNDTQIVSVCCCAVFCVLNVTSKLLFANTLQFIKAL